MKYSRNKFSLTSRLEDEKSYDKWIHSEVKLRLATNEKILSDEEVRGKKPDLSKIEDEWE